MCPLPIDWLDFLEGRPSEAKADHLDMCVSCAALVNRLQQSAGQAPVKAISWVQEPSLSSWKEGSQPDVAFGQIWLCAPNFTEDGFSYELGVSVPLLILGIENRDDGPWVDSVPLWNELELATASDLLLEPDATTLATPLRALFDLQGRLARRQLASCVGNLTAIGRMVIDRTLGGYNADSHGYASAEDPRVVASTDLLRSAVGALQSFALYGRDRPADKHQVSIVSTTERVSHPLNLHWEAERAPFHTDLLLAASTDPRERRFVVEFKEGPRWFRGILRHDLWHGDLILLEIEDIEGIDTPVQILIRTSQSETVSSPFIPKRDAKAVLTQGAGIALDDIASAAVVQA